MSDWSAGYVADIDYTFGYYKELNPLRLELAFLKAGLAMPRVGTACELGFGQGLSANVHAAASLTRWHGTDFNPGHAAFAQELAGASGARVNLQDDAFDAFAERPDLPNFDYIGLHGIWSWISDHNRAVLVEFIRRKLNVGGVLYISYNTQPGWATFAPVRHLMAEHAQVLGAAGGGIVGRIDDAIAFASTLLKTHPAYVQANPSVAERIETLKGQNRQYLAHEYFNRDWQPMPFANVADWLAPAKLQFACSAHYLEHIDSINLTGEQQTLLQKLPDPMFRQSVRDFMVNQQFRRDYWVKGARRGNPVKQTEDLRGTRVILTTPRDQVPLEINGVLGGARMSQDIVGPMLDQLADHRPKTLGQLEQALSDQSIHLGQLLEASLLLAGSGHLDPVQDDHVIHEARKQTDALNAHLMSLARSGSDISHLASPVTGGGIDANRFEQLFLLALKQGHTHPAAWADVVWQVLSLQGEQIVRKGNVLTSAEDNLAELKERATMFGEKRLPVFQALQIAD